MRWILYCIVLGLCLCSGLAGLTAGIILNPKNTIEFVPVWGSLGDWVAGLGTVFAVWVALDQSKRQQDRERANLKITVEHGNDFFSVRFLSNGLTPVTVLAVHMEYDDYESSINLATRSSGNIKLPQKLLLGDTLDLVDFRDSDFSHFGQTLADPIIGRLSDSGVHPSDGNFGVNEAFFQGLEAAGSRKARLFLRAAHEDIVYELPQELVINLLEVALKQQRKRREDEISRLKRDLAEMVQLAALFSESETDNQND